MPASFLFSYINLQLRIAMNKSQKFEPLTSILGTAAVSSHAIARSSSMRPNSGAYVGLSASANAIQYSGQQALATGIALSSFFLRGVFRLSSEMQSTSHCQPLVFQDRGSRGQKQNWQHLDKVRMFRSAIQQRNWGISFYPP